MPINAAHLVVVYGRRWGTGRALSCSSAWSRQRQQHLKRVGQNAILAHAQAFPPTHDRRFTPARQKRTQHLGLSLRRPQRGASSVFKPQPPWEDAGLGILTDPFVRIKVGIRLGPRRICFWCCAA